MELVSHMLEPRSMCRINSLKPGAGGDSSFLIIFCQVRFFKESTLGQCNLKSCGESTKMKEFSK